MGALAQEAPPLHDLKVTIVSSTRVYPPKDHKKRFMFLSNIDQILNFNVETVHFFPANPNFPPPVAADMLRSAVEELLVPYDFLAGRLRLNSDQGRLEIDCNAAGVGFVLADSGLELADLGDLEFPNSAFRQLAVTDPPDALVVFQVTSFKCGGFTIGITTNHCCFDGIGFHHLLNNLAAVLAGKPLPFYPRADRQLLAARDPPRIVFPHTELVELPPLLPAAADNDHSDSLPPLSTILDADNLILDLFRLTADDINTLKSKACDKTNNLHISSFYAVTAHIWRCKILSSSSSDNNKLSTALFAVDMRGRLRPQLPKEYCGNAVMSAVAELPLDELKDTKLGLAKAAAALKVATEKMDDEYGRSVVDWGEKRRGAPKGDMLVTSWWRLGFAEVEYPWGKPIYTCPVPRPNRDIVLLFPPMSGGAAPGKGVGVNVMVALPPEDMEKFTTLFYDF